MGQPVKHCPSCGVVRSIDDFNRNRSRYDGLQGECRWCHVDRTAAWKRRHRERANAAERRRHRRHRKETTA